MFLLLPGEYPGTKRKPLKAEKWFNGCLPGYVYGYSGTYTLWVSFTSGFSVWMEVTGFE